MAQSQDILDQDYRCVETICCTGNSSEVIDLINHFNDDNIMTEEKETTCLSQDINLEESVSLIFKIVIILSCTKSLPYRICLCNMSI